MCKSMLREVLKPIKELFSPTVDVNRAIELIEKLRSSK